MFGLIVGTLCLIALIATLRRRRYGRFALGHAYGYGPMAFGPGFMGHGFGLHGPRGYGYGGYGHRGGRGPRFLFELLDTTPGQEKVIAEARDGLRARMKGSREELLAARKDLAAAVGGDLFDAATLEAALGRGLAVAQKATHELAQVLPAVLAALDGEQRKRLAELIAEGRGWRRGLGFGC